MKTTIKEILDTQDLGGLTIEKVVKAVEEQNFSLIENEVDPLTKVIVENYLDADDEEEFNDHMDYSIAMLKRAKIT